MSPFSRGAILALSLLLFAACDSAEERAEKHFQSGMELLESGDVKRALLEFRNVLALDSTHREARLAYAEAARSIGNLSESYQNYFRLSEQFPEDTDIRLALAEIAILSQNWEEAENHAQRLIDAEAESDGLEVVKLALDFRNSALNEETDQLREMTRKAEALVEARPDDPILERLLIEGYLVENEPGKALAILNRAIAAGAGNQQYYQMKAQLLANDGDFEGLEAHLRATLEAFPDDEEAKTGLIGLLVQVGKTDRAEAFLRDEIAAARDKDKIGAHVNLVAFIRETRGLDAALAEVDVALDQHQDDGVLGALKAAILFDSGDADAAVRILQAVVDGADPGEQADRFRITLAKMLMSNGNEVGARQIVEAVLADDPGMVEALKMQAAWLIESDRMDEAINTLRRAMDQEPEDAEAMTLLARAHERNGDTQLAQDLLALAVEASGNAADESLRFAQVLMRDKRFRAAEDVLIKALRREPKDLTLLVTLGDIYLATSDWPRAAQVEVSLRQLNAPKAQLAADDLHLQIVSRREGREQGMAFLEQLAGEGDASVVAKITLIRAHLANEDGEAALALANELVADLPDNSRATIVLGNTQLALRDYDAAESTFRAILAKDDDSVAAMQLVRVLGAQGRTEEASQVVDEMLARMPENPDLLWARASFLERDHDIDGAIAIYERLYELNSQSPVVANNLASLLATYREDDASLERAYTVGRRLRGTDLPPFQDTFGWILFRRGDVEEALTYLEPAAEALSSDPIVQYHLGKAYAALDRNTAAMAAFTASVRNAPKDDPRPQIADANANIKRLSGKPSK